MAFSIVTGRGESDHVTSDDMGRFQAATLGGQRCVIEGLEVSLVDNNTVHVSGGMLYVDGRYFRCTDEGEYLTISNGAQDRNRIDCIVLRYRMDEFGVDYYEYGELAVLQGDFAAGEPACPPCAEGSILGNDKLVEVPLWTIPITGLSVGDPSELLIKRGYSLPVALGGTGSDNADDALKNLGAAKTKHNHSPDDITGGTLPKEHGGTGMASSPSLLVNLASTAAAGVLQASPRPGVTGVLPEANGGTGVKSSAAIGLKAYPVNAVYLSRASANPAALFGGTWAEITDSKLFLGIYMYRRTA